MYRIRTTSHHTVQDLLSALRNIRKVSGGAFGLRLTNHEGVGPDGLKRNYPVFVFNMKPRGRAFRLTSDNFRRAHEAADDLDRLRLEALRRAWGP